MKQTTKLTFQKDVIESKKIVLLDVWASWCAPCRGMNPIIDKIAEEMKDKVEVIKLDATTEIDFAQELGVTGLPTFIVFKNGKMVNMLVGATSKEKIVNILG